MSDAIALVALAARCVRNAQEAGRVYPDGQWLSSLMPARLMALDEFVAIWIALSATSASPASRQKYQVVIDQAVRRIDSGTRLSWHLCRGDKVKR